MCNIYRQFYACGCEHEDQWTLRDDGDLCAKARRKASRQPCPLAKCTKRYDDTIELGEECDDPECPGMMQSVEGEDGTVVDNNEEESEEEDESC